MAEPSAALLVVDMLNDFVLPGAPLEVPAARAIVPAIRLRIDQAGEAGIPVVFLCDALAEDDPEFRIWPMHAVKGTDGAAMWGFGVEVARDSVAALTRDENDFAVDQMAKVLKVEII